MLQNEGVPENRQKSSLSNFPFRVPDEQVIPKSTWRCVVGGNTAITNGARSMRIVHDREAANAGHEPRAPARRLHAYVRKPVVLSLGVLQFQTNDRQSAAKGAADRRFLFVDWTLIIISRDVPRTVG